MTLVREIGIAVSIVIATLWLQSVGLAALILWIRHAVANGLHRLGPLLSAVLVVRTHSRDNRSAWSIDSILGELLSPALFLVLGLRALLLGKQLRHGGLRRRSLTVKLANAGAARKHYRRLDVRNIRQPTVCDCDPTRQPRSANFALIF
jgi:hypothetical protein